MGKKRKTTPIRDWIDQLFDPERRIARRARIREIWEDSRDLLIGLYEELMDDIEGHDGDPGEALEHIWAALLDEIVEDIAAAADSRLDWQRIPRAEIRSWLEEHDGDFIRRLLMVARARAARRRHRPRPSRLLTLLPGPVVKTTAIKDGPPPSIRQNSPGRRADPALVDETPIETLEAEHIEAPPAPSSVKSKTVAARRMADMLRADRAVTRGGGES